MVTVPEFSALLATATGMRFEEVNEYARALINSGDLPMAAESSVPQQLDFTHRAKLILAIAGSERPSDCVETMRDLYGAVESNNDLDLTAGAYLAQSLGRITLKMYKTFNWWKNGRIEVWRSEPRVEFRSTYFDETGSRHDSSITFRRRLSFDQREERRRPNLGLTVAAFVSGVVLLKVAFNTIEEADNALREFDVAQQQ